MKVRWNNIAIYHLSAKIISRGKGKSAVAAAAYRSGEKLINQYDGIKHDYTRKRGIKDKVILLHPQAPREYIEQNALWNAVEKVEKSKNSQLAREIEIAIPNEFVWYTQKELVLEYVQKNFVDEGMCADICFHDKGDGNPHAHIMLTMRPINEDGTWGKKQKKEYILNNEGNKIYDKKKRQYKCRTISTTDWNEQTKCEEWRKAWADIVNDRLRGYGCEQQIDHRSYEKQGIDQIPTIHMGAVASQMERKGRISERGQINRQIKEDNRILRTLKVKIYELKSAAKQIFDKKVKQLSELLLKIRSHFIVTVYQDISNDVSMAKMESMNQSDKRSAIKCLELEEQLKSTQDRYKQYDIREELLEAYRVSGFTSPKDVEKAVAILKDRDTAVTRLKNQKEVLHRAMDKDVEQRVQTVKEMTDEEFASVLAEERMQQSIYDKDTKKLLQEQYGSKYQEVVFEEAVKCTDTELRSKNQARDHAEIVKKVLESDAIIAKQTESLKRNTPNTGEQYRK